MSILLFAIIALIIAALCVGAVERIPMDFWISRIIQAGILIVAALVIAQRAGLV